MYKRQVEELESDVSLRKKKNITLKIKKLLTQDRRNIAKKFQKQTLKGTRRFLRPIESRARLIALYQKAIKNSYENKPGEILALMDGMLPEELYFRRNY